MYINNIAKAYHTSTVSLYTDHTKMHSSSKDIDLDEHSVNEDLRSVQHWFRRNSLICNTKKTETMVIASQKALKTTKE